MLVPTCRPPTQRRAWPDRKAYGVVTESVSTMNHASQGTTFRSLPLTSEQDSEIRHYIHTKQRKGQPLDTLELRAMLADMLNPPEVADDDLQASDDSMAAERRTAEAEEPADTDQPRSRRS